MAESGVPGFDITTWYGIVAPAKVAPDIVGRLGEAVREAIGLADVQARMSVLGMNPDYRDGDAFRSLITSDIRKYGTIIREAGIQPQ